MPNADPPQHLKQWLHIAKNLCHLLISRESKFADICPHVAPEPSEKRKTLSAIAKDSKEASRLSLQLHDIEKASAAPIGVRALLGDGDIPEHTRYALTLLAMARLSSHLGGEVRTVMDVLDKVAAREAEVSLQVRNLFQFGGELRDSVNVRAGMTVDDYQVTLRESAFSKMMGGDVTPEMIVIEDSGILDGRRGR